MTRLLRRLRCAFTRHAFRRSHLAQWEGWRGGGYTLYVHCHRCGCMAQTRKRLWKTWRTRYEWFGPGPVPRAFFATGGRR